MQRALYGILPPERGVHQLLGLHVAALDTLSMPDLVVVPSALVEDVEAEVFDPVDAAEALLVVEITSKSNAEDDRKAFGDELRLLEPFALTLDTGTFPH